MKRLSIILCAVLCAVCVQQSADAQYYSWGADPASLSWRSLRGEDYRIVYPDTAERIARRTMHYMDAVCGDISFGYRHRQMSIPLVIHPMNFRANGLVMWLPKRIEFLSTPAVASYSMPWQKQLVAHEYRHAVQYNNLNRGVVKILSYLFGQQSSTVGLVFMPLWMIEGDAVMSETEMSTFGRGLQPSFTMPYRAYGDVLGRFPNKDKWFCGSFRDYIPDHYSLGYLICRGGYSRYGEVMGDRVAWLTSRRPYMIISSDWVLKKLFGRTSFGLLQDTFDELVPHWQACADVEQTTVPLPVAEPRSHTVYSWPQMCDDGRVIALKEDLDTPSELVMIDTLTGAERRLARTGSLSTRPALSSTGMVWWTEYRRSTLFEEKVSSRLCYVDLLAERPTAKTVKRRRNVLYPTPMRGDDMAWAEYTPDGTYYVVTSTRDGERRMPVPFDKEIHSLAWDDATERLYAIVTDDDGMCISAVEGDSLRRVTRPSYTTLSDLRAGGGRLYFGSIASGRDELHCYDLAERREYRLSTSRYGSFQPSPAGQGRVVATAYDVRGYLPVMQAVDSTRVEVPYAAAPRNVMLPHTERWPVVNLDTVRFDAAAEIASGQRRSRRFSRFTHAFNIHSWAPVSFDPYSITEESNISFNLGATVMSQNLLSTSEGFLTWGWNRSEGSVFKGTWRYYGLGLNLTLSGTYGGHQNIYPVYSYNVDRHELEFPLPPKIGKYYSVDVGLALPLLFDRGSHTRQLTLATGWNYSNGLVANVGRLNVEHGKVTNMAVIGYSDGIHKLTSSIAFSDMKRRAPRDFVSPWGVVLSVNHAINPDNGHFGNLIVGYAKLYTPGFARHHSLTLAASYQTSLGGFSSEYVLSGMAFKSTRLLPHGFSSSQITNRNYTALAGNYQLPLCYPDGGWQGYIYFKRIRLNLGFDYARFQKPQRPSASEVKVLHDWHEIYSFGGDISLDINLFSSPASATTALTLSLWQPSEGGFYVSFGVGLPF